MSYGKIYVPQGLGAAGHWLCIGYRLHVPGGHVKPIWRWRWWLV